MSAAASHVADGRPIALGPRIGKGGEGEVFALADDPRRAVKLYGPDGAACPEAKIAAMVAARLGEIAPFVAFPTASSAPSRSTSSTRRAPGGCASPTPTTASSSGARSTRRAPSPPPTPPAASSATSTIPAS